MAIVSQSYLPYLANTAAAIAIVPTTVGIGLLFRPQLGLSFLSFQEPTALKDKAVAHGLMRLIGARDLAIGLTTFAVWNSGDLRTLGWTMLSGAIFIMVDGWVSRDVNGRGEWTHWAFVPMNVGIGATLLGWI